MQLATSAASRNGTHTNGVHNRLEAILKRDGRKEKFDSKKITAAVRKCFTSVGATEEDADLYSLQVSRCVANILRNTTEDVDVERIQSLVIAQLWAGGFDEAATHYTLYREDRRRIRATKPIPPEYIRQVAEDQKHFPSPIQYYQFVSKFARWREQDGRRETWQEANNRVFDWFGTIPQYAKLTDGEIAWLRNKMFELKAAPAMRVLQMAGPALERDHIGVYNCSYMPITDIFGFSELLYILMQGTGVGFSVEGDYISLLPRVKKQKKGKHKVVHQLVVADSTEGWCHTLDKALTAWWNGEDVEVDDSGVRPAGTILKTKGGRAAGSGPLLDLLAFAKQVILGAQGRQLTDLEVHDLCCMIGKIVQVGGVRRASCISLSDFDSLSMRAAKFGNWYDSHKHRTMANNSAVYDEKPALLDFMEEWLSLAKSGSGERGIFNRAGVIKQRPTRRKATAYGVNPCITGATLVAVADGRTAVTIKQLVDEGKDVPVYCVDDDKQLTIRMMRNPRVTGDKVQVYKVTLDDGLTVRTTANHKFRLRCGLYREVQELRPGDSLALMTRYTPPYESVTDSYADRYIGMQMAGKYVFEHRLIGQFFAGRKLLPDDDVHHEDTNRFNNLPSNLKVKPAFAHLSQHSTADNNPRYSGFTNNELVEFGRKLTHSLGHKFSTSEWLEFAKINNLPTSFSKWRRKSMGEISTFSKKCASLEGIDTELSELDPRMARSYRECLEAGLTPEVIEGQLFVHKPCEQCHNNFVVRHNRREQGCCSHACSSRYLARTTSKAAKQCHSDNRKKAFVGRRDKTRQQQLEVFARLKNKLGHEPMKKEWRDTCKLHGINTEMNRPSSPFASWKLLLEAAAGFNHRVVSIDADGFEDVYTGTVDDFHNFFVGGWSAGVTNNQRAKTLWINNLQCGEIILCPNSFCNLSIAVARFDDTEETLLDKVTAATYFGVLQSCCTNFNYIRDEWKKNCEEERLLGVDITGHADCPMLRYGAPGRAKLLDRLKKAVDKVAVNLSKRFGINRSAADTCVKPSGDSAEFFGCASGASPRFARYGIRRTRESIYTPVCAFLKDAGVPHEVASEDDSLVAFSWPKEAPEGATLRDDLTAIQQLENWLEWKKHWAEHSVSITVYVEPHEWLQTGSWVYDHWDDISGISFLPKDNGIYRCAPNEELTQEKYDKMVAAFPKIDWSKLLRYEHEDNTTSAQTYACVSGACELV